MIARADITGLILCGGAGTRLDGRDKPLELLAGTPLVEHVRQRLLPQVAHIVISCNRNFDAYAHWGDSIVADDIPDRGPLAGIVAAMARIETDYLFVCPGDAPFLPTALVVRLADALCRDSNEIALPHDGIRPQPLFMLLHQSMAAALRRYLDAGGRAVHGFVVRQRSVCVDVAFESNAFINVNSTADLDAANAALQHARGQPHGG